MVIREQAIPRPRTARRFTVKKFRWRSSSRKAMRRVRAVESARCAKSESCDATCPRAGPALLGTQY